MKHVHAAFLTLGLGLGLALSVTNAHAQAPQDPPPSQEASPPGTSTAPPQLPASDPASPAPPSPTRPASPAAPSSPAHASPTAPYPAGTSAPYDDEPGSSDPSGAYVEPEPPMSEGRQIVVLYNTGFQWGLSPGVVFVGGKGHFFMGVRFGYGFDTGTVILVPGVRLAAYFTDPNIYVGVPMMKLVMPIDRFAPFIEAGAGAGHIAEGNRTSAETGLALHAGAGFMIHFTRRFGLGVEGTYQTITGTGFDGFGVGPILALGF